MTETNLHRHSSAFSRLSGVLSDVVSRPSGAIGLFLVIFHIVLALTSPYLVPFDYKEMNASFMLSGPTSTHWLGADHLGRDVLSRTLLGGREALLVTAIATPIAVIWGGFVGILLGLVGGRIDEVLMRIVDAFLSLPWILKMLFLIVTFGTGMFVLIPTLAFFMAFQLFGLPEQQHMTWLRVILYLLHGPAAIKK